MGWSHFAEAWLGCAPRFQEFSHAYTAAHANHLYPCEVVLDRGVWEQGSGEGPGGGWMGRDWPPKGITVPTASEGIAVTNKNIDFNVG